MDSGYAMKRRFKLGSASKQDEYPVPPLISEGSYQISVDGMNIDYSRSSIPRKGFGSIFFSG